LPRQNFVAAATKFSARRPADHGSHHPYLDPYSLFTQCISHLIGRRLRLGRWPTTRCSCWTCGRGACMWLVPRRSRTTRSWPRWRGILTDAVDGFLVGYRVLICDRGASSRRRRARRADADSGAECQCLRGAIRAFDPCRVPRSAHCLRERRLRHVVDQFVAHYHGERNHQDSGMNW